MFKLLLLFACTSVLGMEEITLGPSESEATLLTYIKHKKYLAAEKIVTDSTLSEEYLHTALELTNDAAQKNIDSITSYTHAWRAFSSGHSFGLCLSCKSVEKEREEQKALIRLLKTKLNGIE